MELKTDVELSYADRNRELRLPKDATEDLAEFLGIIMGDGHVAEVKSGKSITRKVEITGHSEDDYDFFMYISEMVEKLFGLKATLRKLKNQNTIRISIFSMGLFNFLKENGFPVSPRRNASIPEFVMEDKILSRAFLRGLFDTDGCISFKKRYKTYPYYPAISLKQRDRQLVDDVIRILKEDGFRLCAQFNETQKDKRGFTSTRNAIYMYGKKNLDDWLVKVGFRNSKHKNKIRKYHGNGGI